MSYDPKAEVPPMGHMEQRPSRKKWWMIGGCGCFMVILLCGGGIGIFGFMVAKPLLDIVQESQAFVRTSEVVADAVGEPVAVADQQNPSMPATYTEDGVTVQEWRFAVEGSKTTGTLVLKIAQKEAFKFERKSLSLELDDGTVIDLDPEEEFNLDIDTGDDQDPDDDQDLDDA